MLLVKTIGTSVVSGTDVTLLLGKDTLCTLLVFVVLMIAVVMFTA